jgi:5-methylthioadenosine/S-adenosylhomocysteine deaminase
MWVAATLNKEMYLDPKLVSPEESLEMATATAARCLRWDKEIGSLEKGKKADLIIVNQHKSNMIPIHDFSIVPNLVYSCDGSNVETVMIDGKIVMKNRELLTINEERVLEKAQKSAEEIVDRIGEYTLKPSWNTS